MIGGIGRVQGQIPIATPFEHLFHQPSAGTLCLGARRCEYQADGSEPASVREPHRASENASDAVNGSDALTSAAQEIPVLGSMRPANRNRESVEQLHIDFAN